MFVSQNASYVNKEDPDLPVCLEKTVLVWIPLGFLWLCAPRHLVSFFTCKKANTKHLSKLYLLKQVNTHRSRMRTEQRTEQNRVHLRGPCFSACKNAIFIIVDSFVHNK